MCNLDCNYPIFRKSVKKPRQVSAVGYNSGLSVLLQPMIADYFATSFSSYGFRLIIHDPYDFPDFNSPNVFTQKSAEALISVTPEMTYSLQEVYREDVETRRCYKYDEIRMNAMSRYSFINCVAECRRLILAEACGCVPYNMPRNYSIRVCQLSDMRCYRANGGKVNFDTVDTRLI